MFYKDRPLPLQPPPLDARTEIALAEAIAALAYTNHGVEVPISRIRKFLATLEWEQSAAPPNSDGSL
jgi:hypothetical protein